MKIVALYSDCEAAVLKEMPTIELYFLPAGGGATRILPELIADHYKQRYILYKKTKATEPFVF